MDLKLKNKIVVVIGGSNGIGLSIVKNYLKYGAIVHCISRNSKKGLENSLHKQYGKNILFHYCDATNENDILSCKNIITNNNKIKIDILICNVGNGSSPNNAINNYNEWNLSWKINFESSLNSVRSFLLSIDRGSIIFIGSIAGQEFINAPTDYSVAKSALISFSKILSHKLAPNIRVNVVSPGNIFVKDGTWDIKSQESPDFVNDLINKKVPLKRFGETDEVANLVLFLSSEKASFITGSCYTIDGGQTTNY